MASGPVQLMLYSAGLEAKSPWGGALLPIQPPWGSWAVTHRRDCGSVVRFARVRKEPDGRLVMRFWSRLCALLPPGLRQGSALSALVIYLATLGAAGADTKRIFLLNSFGPNFPPYAQRIRVQLAKQSPEPVDILEASLAASRLADPKQEEPFANYLGAMFAGRPLDLIIAVGSPAASFVERQRARLFPNTPLLIAGVERRRTGVNALLPGDAVSAMKIDLPGFIENILRVMPQTTTVAFVVGNSPVEKFWLGELREASKPFANRVNLIWFDQLPFEEMKRRASALPPRSAIFFGLLIVDAADIPYEEEVAFASLRAVANAPLFSYVDTYFGRGIVGGPMISTDEVGRQAADLAVRMLRGERPGDVGTRPLVESITMFDWRELDRWHVTERLLPMGSKVMFKPPSLWEQYRDQLLALAVLLSLQTLLIVGLVVERQRRHRAERAARQSISELAHMNRIVTANQLTVTLAHEVRQPLAAMVANASAGLRWLDRATPNLDEARSAFHRIVGSGHRAAEVVQTIRGMFRNEQQQCSEVDVNQLIRQVAEVLEGELRKQPASLELQLDPRAPKVMGDRVQLQQVILNLLMNGIEAMDGVTDRERVLRLKSEMRENEGVCIIVEDSGIGIPESEINRIFEPFFSTKPNGMGMGLTICRSIVEMHNGRLWVTPRVPHGSVFYCLLPAGQETNHSM